jgi:membrane-associated phospholipid phosphatase
MRGWSWLVALWLVVLTAAEVVALAAVATFFVRSRHGQVLDWIALTGNEIGHRTVSGPVNNVLNTISVVSLVVATGVIVFIAVIRQRVAVAVVSVLVIAGANVSSELLKMLLTRPSLGIDTARAAAGNSLPSGHTTVAASVAFALVLALPTRVRGIGALIGGVVTALVGVATMSAGWHRPSDAVASVLLVGAWSGVGGLLLLAVQGTGGAAAPVHHKNLISTVLLALAGVALIAVAVAALHLTDQVTGVRPDDLSRHRLLAAYGGAAAGIAGATSLVMAAFLVTLHRIVPPRGPAGADDSDETTEVLVVGDQST